MRIVVEGRVHPIEEARPDDAARLPDARHASQIGAEVVDARPFTQQRETLGIAHQLGGVERVLQVVHRHALHRHPGALAVGLLDPLAFRLQRRQGARIDRRRHRGQRHAHVDRLRTRPTPRALLSRHVENRVDQRALAVRIARAADQRRDLDEIGLQLGAVPVREDLRHLPRCQAEAVAQQRPHLGDQLHVPVFDAVVHHLDEVAGTAPPAPVHAGAAV